jgi:hypothetical protein
MGFGPRWFELQLSEGRLRDFDITNCAIDEGLIRRCVLSASSPRFSVLTVYGYSQLMGNDEEATFRTLASHRRIIDHLIEQHHGHFVNSAGDSVLAEFARVVNEVECAVERQARLKTENPATLSVILSKSEGSTRSGLSYQFEDIRQAIAREKQIKGWLRSRKIQLVETVNPPWKDLSLELLPDK